MTTIEAYWHELVTTSLVGTGRQTPPPVPNTNPAGQLLAGLPKTTHERFLLLTAATVGLYRRAGQPTTTAITPPLPPCTPDDQPSCSAAAAHHLASMLSNNHPKVLPEWLAAAAAAGYRVPHHQLVALLQLGTSQKSLHGPIRAVLGQRGRWLADHNPAWAYARGNADMGRLDEAQMQQRWETGQAHERLELLQYLRQYNTAQARTLLQLTWKSEKADDRRRFLDLCGAGLSMDDEPWLETVLDDRSTHVRTFAAVLLGKLPESRLCQRMQQRAMTLITLKDGGLLKRRSLEVTLPDTCDEAMVRDGIACKPPSMSYAAGKEPWWLSEKSWWLAQIVSFVPTNYWYQQWQLGPHELIKAAQQSDWTALLVHAWTQAAHRSGDLPFLEALLPLLLKHNNQAALDMLTEGLPADWIETIILRLLHEERQPIHLEHAAMPFLLRYQQPWSHRLARAVWQSVQERLAQTPPKKSSSFWYTMSQLVVPLSEMLALRFPADMAREVAVIFADEHDPIQRWHDPLKHMVVTLQFRDDMLKELTL
ncbi:MAG: hypothetical protein HC837_05100 [Chloroflexaceae bacterium]|nr:hypothetical protein [Chloroflexaceae bacterium]